MKHATRSRRVRQRPRTRKIQRHQNQPLLWPESTRPVFTNRQVRVKVAQRGPITPYGGLALAHDLALRLQLDREINRSITLLRINAPYFESDHILTHVYNLYVGGGCIEDISNLQHSDAIKHLLGACRIPDPTTAGDFLRRFHEPHLKAFQTVIDRAREKVWRQMPRSRRKVATIDLDSTIKEIYGECNQGADFAYNGKWSYHPFLATLAETNEPLRTINRPGNAASATGAIPRWEMDAAEVFCFAYGRCDQENIIEQFKNGIAALRMPTGELLANSAFLLAGQLAWCLRAWLSLLALPAKTIRWEWKWFRQAFVYIAAKISHCARRAKVYLAGSHRFVEHLVIASRRLESLAFR